MMAERGGFEPPIPLRVCHLSKVVPSTTRTPLQAEKVVVVYYSPHPQSIAKSDKEELRGADLPELLRQETRRPKAV